YYDVYGGRNRQYTYYGTSDGATNGGMIIATGAVTAAASFYPYLNMAKGGHVSLAATPAMQPAVLSTGVNVVLQSPTAHH
nr:hypothetical protein [Tanacetum cinerariifolium]